MDFRDRMKVETSNAEIKLFTALQNLGIRCELHRPIILCESDIYVQPKQYGKGLHVFVDGPHHEKPRQNRKDELFNDVLNRRKQPYIRLPYKPPLSKKQLREWIKKIREELK